MPWLMLTGPVNPLAEPVNVHVELPILLIVPNALYCVPNCAMSNAPLPVPPNWNVSLPVPRTSPVMIEPGASVSVLPDPPKRIAALPPEMVPALNTDEPPPMAEMP